MHRNIGYTSNIDKVKPYKIRTNFIFTKIIESQYVTGNGCNSIIFINSGAAPLEVSGVSLTTNQSLAFNCNTGEEDYTSYNIVFTGAGARDLNVIQKFNTID